MSDVRGGTYRSEAGALAVLRRYEELLAAWPVPAEHTRVPTREGETFVVTCGPAGAPPLVLLHGSGAYAAWLDDVLDGLGVGRFSAVGVSLGGWLALDHAIRRPGRAERLALLCPSGVGRQRVLPLLAALPLLAVGERGRRRAMRMAVGPAPDADPAIGAYTLLIHRSFRPRGGRVPVFADEALRGLTARLLPEAGHVLPGQTTEIMEFLEARRG